MPAWRWVLLRLEFLDGDTTKAIIGSMVIVLAVAASAAVLFHLLVVTLPRLRLYFRPRLVGHLAALALLWVAYGSILKICSMPFPYLRSRSHEQPQQ